MYGPLVPALLRGIGEPSSHRIPEAVVEGFDPDVCRVR